MCLNNFNARPGGGGKMLIISEIYHVAKMVVLCPE